MSLRQRLIKLYLSRFVENVCTSWGELQPLQTSLLCNNISQWVSRRLAASAEHPNPVRIILGLGL